MQFPTTNAIVFISSFEVIHSNFQCEKLVWILASAYFDKKIPGQAITIKLLMLTKENTIKINVGHIKFQPTWISHPP